MYCWWIYIFIIKFIGRRVYCMLHKFNNWHQFLLLANTDILHKSVKNKFFFCWWFLLIWRITDFVPETSYDSCVPISRCLKKIACINLLSHLVFMQPASLLKFNALTPSKGKLKDHYLNNSEMKWSILRLSHFKNLYRIINEFEALSNKVYIAVDLLSLKRHLW